MVGDDIALGFKPILDKTSNEYEQYLSDEILKKIKGYAQELVEEALEYEKGEDRSYSVIPNSNLNTLPSAPEDKKEEVKSKYNKNNKSNVFNNGLLKTSYIYTVKKTNDMVDEDGKKIEYDLEDPAFAKELKTEKRILITRVQAHDFFENPIKTYTKNDVIENVKDYLINGMEEGAQYSQEAIDDLDFEKAIFVEFFEEENLWWNRSKDEMDDILDQYNKNKKVTGIYNDGICYLRTPLKSDPETYVNFYFDYFECNNKNKHINDAEVVLIKTNNKQDEDPVYTYGKNLISLEYIEDYSFSFKDDDLKKFLKTNK
jgi:hypothetical protein